MKLLFTTHSHITDVLSRKSLKDYYYYYFYYYCYVHWKCEISWRILFPLFFPKKGNKKIQWCCPAFTPLYFLLAPIHIFWSICLAWQNRNKTFKHRRKEQRQELSSLDCIIKHFYPHESDFAQSQRSLPRLPFNLTPLSVSIRQTWRSLWSMCSRETLKRSHDFWKKAWILTSMIQTQEVRNHSKVIDIQ